jgi:hypothetical protein
LYPQALGKENQQSPVNTALVFAGIAIVKRIQNELGRVHCITEIGIVKVFIGDRLCGLVLRVPGYRSRGPGSISNATRVSEKKWVWNGVHSAS